MIELAKLQNKELVYGTYEEVEAYAEKKETCVDRYLDHVAPFVVQKPCIPCIHYHVFCTKPMQGIVWHA